MLFRPPSLLYKHAHLFFVRLLSRWLLPIVFCVTFFWNLLRASREEEGEGPGGIRLLLVEPVSAVLPLLPLSFPPSWLVVNYVALAWVLGVYSCSRHVKVTDDPFEDTVEEPDIRTENRYVVDMQ